MIVENHLVRWSVRIAMLLYVAALAGQIQATRKGNREAASRQWQLAITLPLRGTKATVKYHVC